MKLEAIGRTGKLKANIRRVTERSVRKTRTQKHGISKHVCRYPTPVALTISKSTRNLYEEFSRNK